MKVIQIHQRENVCNLTYEFLIVLFGLVKIRRVLFHHQVVMNEYPFWYRATKWLLKVTCKHKYKKEGGEYLQGYFIGDTNTFLQNWKCEICQKIVTSQREQLDYP